MSCLQERVDRTWLHATKGDLALVGVGAVIGIAVCCPFFGGRLLLLDWVSGPNQAIVPSSAWGLAGPSAAGVPAEVLLNLFDKIFGQAGSWLPVLFPSPRNI